MAKKTAVPNEAYTNVSKHDTILATERDREIFFDALMNSKGPNQKLRDAAERYKLFMKEQSGDYK